MNNQALTEQHIYDSLSMLSGAVSIVYPMGLPPYDPIQEHLDNRETKEIPQVGNITSSKCLILFEYFVHGEHGNIFETMVRSICTQKNSA